MAVRKTKEEFILRSKQLHGNLYDYSNINYINNKIKVSIKCKIHGLFLQTPNDHIGGHGCSKCQKDNRKNYNLKEAYSEKNKDFPLNLYVVKIDTLDVIFLKIGISKNIEQRLKNLAVKTKGKIKKLLIYPCTLQEATLLEDFILVNLKKKYSITFPKKFPGYTECLDISSKDAILESIKLFISNDRSDLVGKILDAEYGN